MTYIDPRGKPFAHLARLAAWQAGDKPAPVTLEWDLSNRCVLGCQDCHFAYTHTRGPWAVRERSLPVAYEETGDVADYALVGRVLKEVALAGVQGVVWTGGGEPTTHPCINEIVGLAAAQHLKQGMYTLGGLIDEDQGWLLKKGLDWVVVSLDACDHETYAKEKGVSGSRFQVACDGVRNLSGGRAVVGVSFLLHEGNWHRTTEMFRLGLSLGAEYVTFRPTIRTDPAQPGVVTDGDRAEWVRAVLPALRLLANHSQVEVSPERFEEYANWNAHPYSVCHGIKLNATITPNGKVWVCPNRRGMPASCLGDLSQESFASIWARHPGQWTDFAQCRAMCRLHPVNQTLAGVFAERKHESFI